MPSKVKPKKTSSSQKPKSTHVTDSVQLGSRPGGFVSKIGNRISDFMNRRPHRSLRMTRRVDYARSLPLPGYWSFTASVVKLLWMHRRTFAWVVVVYALLTGVLVGFASQDNYTALRDSLQEAGSEVISGELGQLGQASVLLVSGIMGGFATAPSEAQQIYAILIGLLVWLTTVWILRSIQSGNRPRFRDGLYNAGAPAVSTFLLVCLLAVQALPAAVAIIALSAAISSGFIAGGAVAMIFSVAALLLTVLSAYWITSTLLGLIVVTLPGIYPLQAMRAAGDIVVGRRLKILTRWLWLAVVLVVIWSIVMIPVILFDAWVKNLWPAIEWVPIVPISLLAVGSFAILFSASYVYLLYRKVVEDDGRQS